jgi:long-chain acyl-CoA synthetase
VLDTRFDAAGTLRQVRKLGVTTLLGVPTMFAAWADLPDGDAGGASSLAGVRRAISGAAALDADVAVRFERRFGIEIWQGYGLTESSPAVSTSLGTGRNRPGSVGRPLPGVDVQLVDEEDEPVLEGDTGEIWVRGENVFAGYWRDAEATAQVLTGDGWLRTGDIGVIGEEGDLFVVDRSKDLVIVSGFNVFPAEVERVLESHPGVAEAAVVGVRDGDGEAVRAYVVPVAGSWPDGLAAPKGITEAELISHCARMLARYKCPSAVVFVRSLPRGLQGKVMRRSVL